MSRSSLPPRSQPIAVASSRSGNQQRSLRAVAAAATASIFDDEQDGGGGGAEEEEVSFSMMVEGVRPQRATWQAAAASSIAAGRRAVIGSPDQSLYDDNNADQAVTPRSRQAAPPPLEMLRSSSVEERHHSHHHHHLRRSTNTTSPANNIASSESGNSAVGSTSSILGSGHHSTSRSRSPSSSSSSLLKVQPRKVEVWVPDEAAQRCYACGAEFTAYLRRHHCRACGNCFCYDCCRRSVVLPRDLVRFPAPSHRALEFDDLHGVGPADSSSTKRSRDQNSGWQHQVQSSGGSGTSGSRGGGGPSPGSRESGSLSGGGNEGTGIAHSPSSSSSASSLVPSYFLKRKDAPPVRERACERCFENLTRDMAVWPVVRLFDVWQLDVVQLRRVSRVCKLWHAAAMRSLSAFREIQYRLPTETLSEREQRQLQINAHLISGHGLWTFHLLRSRSSAFDDRVQQSLGLQQPTLSNNVVTTDKSDCNSTSSLISSQTLDRRRERCRKTVMCSRYCSESMRSIEALHLLRLPHIVCNEVLYRHSVRWCIDHADDTLLAILMPALSYAVRFQPPNCSDALTAALIPRCATTRALSLTLFWCLTLWSDLAIAMQQYGDCERYARALQHLNRTVGTAVSALLGNGERVVRALMKQRALDPLRGSKNPNTATGGSAETMFLLPTHPTLEFAGVDNSRGATVMQPSASQPVARRFLVVAAEQQKQEEADEDDNDSLLLFGDYEQPLSPSANAAALTRDGESTIPRSVRVLFKREDVRRDLVVMSVIRYSARVLAAELPDFLLDDIVTYNVVPTGDGAGIIEMVEHATTLYDIRHRHQSTLFRFLVERNQQESVATLRARFIRSAAAYSVITYLISAGDRHLENVMVTDDARLFHIDYAYLFGEDPKPLAAPAIRIPPEMIDAIGGEGTESYVQFTEACSRIYNCLRRHVGPISTLLTLLVDMKIVSADKMREHVLSRFMPGECGIEATINLSSTISKSQHTYKQTFIDLSHRSARTTSAFFENPLGVLSSLWSNNK